MAFMRQLFLVLMLLCAGPVQAQVLDAYEGRAPLADPSPAQRDKALREALAQVLARVSGATGIAGSGRTAPILARANQLLRSVSYDNSDPAQPLLVASFNPAAVEEALKQAGLPVWGVLAGQLESVDLRVSGVDSPRAYARALSALQGLPMVKSLFIGEALNGTLYLQLQVEGGAGRLSGALSVINILKRENSEPGVLSYRVSHV